MGNKDVFRRVQADRSLRTVAVADSDRIARHLAGKPDAAVLEGAVGAAAYPSFDVDAYVSRAEVEGVLAALREQFRSERIDSILVDIRSDLSRAVVGPFGLGRILSAYDKTGGNVDTVNNVRQGIYATDKERQAYKERGDYDPNDVHKDRRYWQVNKETSAQQKTRAGVEDGYTDIRLKQDSEKHLDHVRSAKETHDDPARILAELNTEDLANMRENLTPTDATINRAKGAKSIDEFVKSLRETKAKNLKKIEDLETKGTLTRDEVTKLKELKAKQKRLDAVDPEKAKKADKRARDAQDRKINREYYTSKKFARSTLSAGAAEGFKMGVQQAVGLIVIEFLAASFDETRRAIASIGDGNRVIRVLEVALGRVKDRLVKKWADVLSAFVSGGLSGFLSSLLTTLINAVKTTSARVVRLIREGVFSFARAMKVAFFPEKGTSFAESFHAATKLLFSGAIVIGGIALEEIVQDAVLGFLPALGALAVPLTAAIVGGLSALAVAVCCFILDKLDFYGATKLEEGRFVEDRLDAKIAAQQERWDALVHKLEGALGGCPGSG